MVEKGQDVHGGQERGEMLFAMTEVMFQVIALGLERITEGSAAYATPKAAEPSPSPLQKGRDI